MWVIFCLDKCSIYWAPTTCGRSLWKLLGDWWRVSGSSPSIQSRSRIALTWTHTCTFTHAHTHMLTFTLVRPSSSQSWDRAEVGGASQMPDLVSPSSKPHPLPAKHTLYATVKPNNRTRSCIQMKGLWGTHNIRRWSKGKANVDLASVNSD